MTESNNKDLWIKNPLAILAEGAEGGIVVRGGQITQLLPLGSEPDGFSPEIFEIFDAGQHVVLPGLINTHHHFYQTLTRALTPAINKPLFPWLQALYPIWAGLEPEMIALATRLALAELLLSGCTCASDHHYVFNDALGEAIDIQVSEVRDMGMRAVLTRGSMSLSVDDGGLPPRAVVQREDEIMADTARLVEHYHETGDGAQIQIALAPCSPFSVTPDLMRASADFAARHGLRLHTHLAETLDENEFCLSKFKMRPLEYLASVGWISPHVWLAHGIHFNDEEIKTLGANEMGIAHCPGSNMLLASGICRGLELEAAGVHMGLGADGSASNDASNLIQEVRQAMLLQKLKYGAERMDHIRALNWATKGSARCLGRSDIGKIRPGAQADLAMLRLDEPRFSGAGDPLAALIICGAHKADAVMIGGNWRVRGGEIIGLDLGALIAQHSEAAKALQSKAQNEETLRF